MSGVELEAVMYKKGGWVGLVSQVRHGHFRKFSHNQIWDNPAMSRVWRRYSEVLTSLLTTVNLNIGYIF